MSDNVRVAVRVRPFNGREKAMNAVCCIKMNKETQQTMIVHEDGSERKFTFDFSYNSFVDSDHPDYASQQIVYEDLGVDVLNNAWKGFNVSLFAYGQTGAGKSYSMVGYGPAKGVIPLSCEEIFKRIAKNEDEDLTYKVECSMLEIYNEKVRDLFNPDSPKNKKGLKVREHPKKGPYVDGLKTLPVTTYAEIDQLMQDGSAARTVHATAMNASSSRAHTIFTVYLTQTKLIRETMKATDKVSRINLIDLAGSERSKSTGATGDRLKEGCAINQSLSALGNCISALAENSGRKKKKHVPYRNSVLTHLLKDSLGGNAKTIMIAALSPASVNYDETLSTLRYADRAKQIKNKAVVNEDPNQKLIRSLREEIENLKKMLGGEVPVAAGGGGAMPADMDALLEKEREEMKAKLQAEQEAAMREMREKLEASERLLKDSEMSWDDKVSDAEIMRKRRAENMARSGLLSPEEVEARRKVEPCLINLHEDPFMSDVITYFLDREKTTFGRKDAEEEQDITLIGLSIQKEHMFVTNEGGLLTLHPLPGAKTLVNGVVVSEPTELHDKWRVIIGNNHFFRVSHPGDEREESKDEEPLPDIIDFEFAMTEVTAAQMAALADPLAEAAAAEEAAAMAAKMKKLEDEMEAERKRAAEEAAEQKARFEAEMEAEMKRKEEELREKMGGLDEESIKRRMEEQESKLEEERAKQKAAFDAAQAEMVRKQKELEEQLAEQIRETAKLARRKEKERLERTLLDEQLLKTIPMVNEVNAIAGELGKPMTFGVKLIGQQGKTYDETAPETTVWVSVVYDDNSRPKALWDSEKFTSRLYLMREMYQAFLEVDRVIEDLGYTEETDPFFDPPEDQLIGRALIYLDSLSYLLDIEEVTPIIDYKGKQEGELLVDILLKQPPPGLKPGVIPDASYWDSVDEDEDFLEEERLQEIVGRSMFMLIRVKSARGLPRKLSLNTHVQFTLDLEDKPRVTPPCEFASINPEFNWTIVVPRVITEEFCKYVAREAIEFEVWGSFNDGTATHRPPRALSRMGTSPRGGGSSSSLLHDGSGHGAGIGGGGGFIDETEIKSLKEQVAELQAALATERDARAHAESIAAAAAAADGGSSAVDSAELARVSTLLEERTGELTHLQETFSELEREKDQLAEHNRELQATVARQRRMLAAAEVAAKVLEAEEKKEHDSTRPVEDGRVEISALRKELAAKAREEMKMRSALSKMRDGDDPDAVDESQACVVM
eukprot:PLAT8018.2.p1 GENE.PLAT8018.2~~PLAT8018.2.p1  ORF type:complete len:1234 (-),score=747.63 PLAT8018.2:64-3765(-)